MATKSKVNKASGNVELGVSGLLQYGGMVTEETVQQLQGDKAFKAYAQMRDNDSTIGAILFAIEMVLRNVDWRIESYDDTPEMKDQAEFVESLPEDMSHTWEDFISEIVNSMLPMGFSPHELVYKRREGTRQKDPTRRSKFSDGYYGWRKLPLRAPSTVFRWYFDDDGGIKGLEQMPPNGGSTIDIPIERLLLFRTTSHKNNPEGRSILRNCYKDWYHKTKIENYEAIGIERDLCGLPVMYVPPEILDPAADNAVKTIADDYRKIIKNIRNDEQAGLLLPAHFDEAGNRLVEFSLAGTGGRRLFDTDKIIGRYDRRIASTVLADFILLGHEKVGSFALSSDKTDLFATALGAWNKEIAAVLNRHALPRLYELNGWDSSKTAMFVPEDIEKAEVEKFVDAVQKLTSVGYLHPGSEQDEDFWRDYLGMPPTPANVMDEEEFTDTGAEEEPAGDTETGAEDTGGTGNQPPTNVTGASNTGKQ